MKKLIMLSAALLMAAGIACAQSYMVVNTETIFKSIPAYNAAVEEIDAAAQSYQDQIDQAYEELENMYNTYMSQRNSLSASAQEQREQTIVNNEKRIVDYQESVFGAEGSLAQLQIERLEPHQTRVMETIARYARDNGIGMVLDIATNPMVVFYDPAVDRTQQIIALL